MSTIFIAPIYPFYKQKTSDVPGTSKV